MPKRKQKDEDPETSLARCIVLLDDIRAYRRKDAEQIEDQFSRLKRTRFAEFYDMWIKARPAVEKINDMPMKVKGVKESISRLSWLKVGNRVALIVLILFIALQIVPVWRRALGHNFLGGNGILYSAVFVMAIIVSLNVATIIDYLIRKKIIAYEETTMDQYASARDKMKECVGKMMKSLAREVARTKADPNYYGLVLYFDDYANIEVVDKWRPKAMGFFRKSYNHYQVIPKP